MKKCFGYIRVSTPRQGECGVSLQEQRDAIIRYAQRFQLNITSWFEERETAAKRGRPIFNRMLHLLRAGQADGIIIHKIDRSARNLKDWADLGELIDQGTQIHFANESIDLNSRGGRLSADIQAVVAADYIRNLREETRKGIYGRLKQGLYPLPAPPGYADKGPGKVKEPDPAMAHHFIKAFELYATDRYTLDSLTEEMYRLGLRNRNGKKTTRNDWSNILKNPFYMGIIRIRKTGESFAGAHQPLISKSSFDRVQTILHRKTRKVFGRHRFLLSRLLLCKLCGRSLSGEMQKGHTYYRCPGKHYPPTCVREEAIETEIRRALDPVQFPEAAEKYFAEKVAKLREGWVQQQENQVVALNLRIVQLTDRLDRLTDAYIDRMIEKDIYERKKAALLVEHKGIDEQRTALKENPAAAEHRLTEFFELAKSAQLSYEMKLPEERRDFLKIVTSNRLVEGKNIVITLKTPFDEVANWSKNTNGCPLRDRLRTLDRLIEKLMEFFKSHPIRGAEAGDEASVARSPLLANA